MTVGVLVLVLMLGGSLFLGLRQLVRSRRRNRRGFVSVHPAHRAWLRSLQLTEPEHFLDREALIVSGHPGRQVAQLVLEPGQRTLYLKREQGVRWTTRLVHFASGFGLVSRSVREAQVLEALERDGLPGPRWIATGEEAGRAFLLVEEAPGEPLMAALKLRDAAGRRSLAARLGAVLARLHQAGFIHRDLYAKHILVGQEEELSLLDWQRAWRGAWIPRSAQVRDLACLHATLPDDLAGPRERLACLRAYLGKGSGRTALHQLRVEVEAAARRLRRRRHIREKRQPPTAEKQNWIRLDAQALCITPALAELTGGASLDFLALDNQPLPAGQTSSKRWLSLAAGRPAVLFRQRRQLGLWRRVWGWLLRRPIASVEERQATLLWRLKRHGVAAPRVLAFGQRQHRGWMDSFLLLEEPNPAVRLQTWLAERPVGQHPAMFYQAGVLLARMHEACCSLGREGLHSLAVRLDPSNDAPALVLQNIHGVQRLRRPGQVRVRRDLVVFRAAFAKAAREPADWWSHFEQGYASLQSSERLRTNHSPQAEGAQECRSEKRRLQPVPPSRRSADVKHPSFWQRLLSGWRRFSCRPDWEQYAGPGWPERIMQVGVTNNFHAKQGRSTGRWVLNAPQGDGQLVVYLKRHHLLPFWHGWLATLWPRGDWSPAMQERRNLEWARAQGLPVPATVAAGEFIGPLGRLSSFLAVEELTDMLPLNLAIPLAASQMPAEAFRAWKRGLAAEMARLARLLHDRRRFHKDLYLCHFFIHRDDAAGLPAAVAGQGVSAALAWRGRVVLIDLHRLTHHPWTWWVWLLKDLAQLLYSSEVPGVDVRDQVAFWKHYRGPGARRSDSRWLRRLVIMKWRRYRAHNLRRKKRISSEG